MDEGRKVYDFTVDSDDEDERQDWVKVRLHPFLHQVSGSTLMFNFDKDTICKPLLENEYLFYHRLPESLKRFTAQYKGSIGIETESSEDGMCRFFGFVSSSQIPDLNTDIQSKYNLGCYFDFLNKETVLKLKRSGSIEMDDKSIESYADPAMKVETGCRLSKRLNQLLQGNQHKFILLENLVSKFKCPSILDLKMGTRTHADDDTDVKKVEKICKAQTSTTGSLGVRLHGMQKYNSITGKYETLTKLNGLKLANEEFAVVMQKFFHNGTTYRSDLVEKIVHTLEEYYECIRQQDCFRFYSSSLLIIYDGAQMDDGVADVRAIDFAHTVYPGSLKPLNSDNHIGPDMGYLLGIKSLINILSRTIHCSSEAVQAGQCDDNSE